MSLYTFTVMFDILVVVFMAAMTAAILENQNKLYERIDEKIDEIIKQIKEKEE